MRHDIVLEGGVFRLRPVTENDALDIINLRADAERARFLHPISSRVEDQLEWLEKYFRREGDYYFAIERLRDGRFEGTTSLYDIAENRGLFGRWVLRSDSLAATESVFLTYRVGFEILELKNIYTLAVSTNRSVLSFHDNCGLQRIREIPNAFVLNGVSVDAIEHNLSVENWPHIKLLLVSQAQKVANLLNRQR